MTQGERQLCPHGHFQPVLHVPRVVMTSRSPPPPPPPPPPPAVPPWPRHAALPHDGHRAPAAPHRGKPPPGPARGAEGTGCRHSTDRPRPPPPVRAGAPHQARQRALSRPPCPTGRSRKSPGRGGGAEAMGALLILLLLQLPGTTGGAGVCGSCPGLMRNDSVVAQFCASRPGTESEGRCCWDQGVRPERLLGLDLSDCSLQNLPPGLAEASSAAVLDLTENPLTTLPNGSFLGFTLLQLLAVPLPLECPGGNSAWEEVTTSGSSRLCQGQRNSCNSSGEPAWPCPENAACAPDGPGLVQCLCNSPFHGYKCLREGTFPLLLFCGVLGATTLSLSLLLWGTQRRKAKAP
uniref:Uncharacterized protein n=2 Tax=Melopsittacus undulatus TaxID=13146 RepID=A0A8C6IZV2_MELUD